MEYSNPVFKIESHVPGTSGMSRNLWTCRSFFIVGLHSPCTAILLFSFCVPEMKKVLETYARVMNYFPWTRRYYSGGIIL